MKIVDHIRSLIQPEIINKTYDETAADVSRAIIHLLGEIELSADDEKYWEWVDGVTKLRCDVIGEHSWTYDQCGYWGHQFCDGCRQFKYPELAGKRCNDAFELTGNASEEEYASKRTSS